MGNREKVENVLIEIINDIEGDGIDFEKLDYDAELKDQIDFDSMDFLDIVMGLRKKYGIKIEEKDYEYLRTMNSSINYLSGRI